MPNFIKYLLNIRAHFIIKIKLWKIKLSLKLLDQFLFFFKSIIGLIQIFGESNSYFCRLNFENIKIIIYIYIYIYIQKIFKILGGPWPLIRDTVLTTSARGLITEVVIPTINVGNLVTGDTAPTVVAQYFSSKQMECYMLSLNWHST